MSRAKCRILYVDDHEDAAVMLQHLLSHEDYEVVVATSMAQAKEIVRHDFFDLYVLDKRLPDGTGIELCQILNDLTPAVPCIFYSGDAYEIHKQEALAAGADAYIAKPDIVALIDAVHKLLLGQECAATT